MGKKLNYFDMADNDYNFLKEDYERGRFGNIMCYAAQNICERYIKHIIDVYCVDVDTTSLLRTHNIRILRDFMIKNFGDFKCDWAKVIPVNGYYYDARCPGEDSLIATKENVEECWVAVEEVRSAVLSYIESRGEVKRGIIDESVLQELKGF